MSTTPVISDREVLERFKESQTEIRSVAQIAAMDEGGFVEQYANNSVFADDIRQARRVYKLANNLNAKNSLIWANIKDAVASPHYRATLFNNIPQEFIEHLENIPGYQRLFGSLDYVDYEHCRSVFGPAAYFVDLMRFIQTHITGKAKTGAFRLDEHRRPDLYNFRLDCKNTDELMPYIDLVNEVLEAVVRTEDEPDAFKIVATAPFPMNLPFNRPLAEIREYLTQLGTSLHAIYQAYQRTQAVNHDHIAAQIDREFLALSPQNYDLLGEEATEAAEIEKRYGTAYEITGYSLDNVTFDNDAGKNETIKSDVQQVLADVVGRPFLTYDALEQELTQIISELGTNNTADHIKDHLPEIITQAFNRYDVFRLSSLPIFLEQTGLNRKEANDLFYQDLDGNEFYAGLSRLFFINNVADGLGPIAIEDGPGGPSGFDEQITNLSYAKLDRIYRFLRLARKLEWSFKELDLALRALHEPFTPEPVLYFDGIDDYVAIREIDDLNIKAFTIEAWVNPAKQGYNIIVAKGQEEDGKQDYKFYINLDGKLTFDDIADEAITPKSKGQSEELKFVTGKSTIPLNAFSHVALVVDDTHVRFYLNGLLDGEIALKSGKGIRTTGTDLDIGRDLNDTYFEGIIQEVKLWSEPRSQDVIARNRFRRLTGQEDKLAGYWPLTDNQWSKFLDLSGNGNEGIWGGDGFVTQPTWVKRDLILDGLPDAVTANGYQFNGVDQYLARRNVTGFDQPMEALTLEAWVTWQQNASSGESAILAKGESGGGKSQFRLWIDNKSGKLYFLSTDLKETFRSTKSIAKDTPTHIAITLPESALGGAEFQATDELSGKIDDIKLDTIDYIHADLRSDALDDIKTEVKKLSTPTTGEADFLEKLSLHIGRPILKTLIIPKGQSFESFITDQFPVSVTDDEDLTKKLKDNTSPDIFEFLCGDKSVIKGQEFATRTHFLNTKVDSGERDFLSGRPTKETLEAHLKRLDPNVDIEKILAQFPISVTQNELDAVSSPSIPNNILEALKSLLDQDFDDQKVFLDALHIRIGQLEIAPYHAQILRLSEIQYLRFYINGQPDESQLINQTTKAPLIKDAIRLSKQGDTLRVGRKLRDENHYYHGLLKEVRVWNQPRTEDQVVLNMHRAVGNREPGLVGYWRFDTIDDGQARDQS
ncbi:MAG: LamG-like jellyroll fold domain-containing protein, partial [Chloroflexota bacterium]